MAEISPFAHLSNDQLRQELNNNDIAYGPIMSNTRKVYEKKLQQILEGGNNGHLDSSLVNGNGIAAENGDKNGVAENAAGRSPSRETSPAVMEQPAREIGQLQGGGGGRETSPKPAANSEDSDDEETDASECARMLTPDEVRDFRTGLIRRYTESPKKNGSSASVRLRRELSTQPEGDKHKKGSLQAGTPRKLTFKRLVVPILVFLVLAGFAAAVIHYRDYLALPVSLPQLMKKTFGGGGGVGQQKQVEVEEKPQQPALDLEDWN